MRQGPAEANTLSASRPSIQHPNGRWRGFLTSSISWSGSLSHNGYKNNVSKITGNVLERFLEEKPFS